MHSLTLRELREMHADGGPAACRIEAEKQTVLPSRRIGSYDFLVKTGSGAIGVEVMTRPTKGKLKEKLRYRHNVDSYVFVLPANSLGLYRKKPKKGFHTRARPRRFPKEFNDSGIRAWLLDAGKEKFTEKGAFAKIFNVES